MPSSLSSQTSEWETSRLQYTTAIRATVKSPRISLRIEILNLKVNIFAKSTKINKWIIYRILQTYRKITACAFWPLLQEKKQLEITKHSNLRQCLCFHLIWIINEFRFDKMERNNSKIFKRVMIKSWLSGAQGAKVGT